MKYKIALHQSDEGYSVSAPGLPGCWSQGKTEAEALANIETAVREYLNVVEDLLEDAEVRARLTAMDVTLQRFHPNGSATAMPCHDSPEFRSSAIIGAQSTLSAAATISESQ